MSGIKLSNVRKFAISGAAAVAVALPLAMVSAPAQAATTLSGCTVTPLRPVVVGQVGGVPQVKFSTRVQCAKDRIIEIRDQRYEADAPAGVAGDDSYGNTRYLRTFDAQRTIVVSKKDLVTSTENSNEEVYHRVSFRVATINGVSAWTNFENSPERSVNN